MELDSALRETGLSKGEIEVYLSLLKLGSVPVSKIKEHTSIHRTTIYDFLEKLLNKGLVNYIIKGNVKYYNAGAPENLLEFLKEKEERIKEALPELKKLSEFEEKKVTVEVYEGKEGFKTVLNDVIRVGQDCVGFGIDESRFKKRFPVLMEQYFKKEEEAGIQERLLTSEEAGFIYKKPTTNYRYITKEFFNPTPTLVYGDNIYMVIWEPLTAILIRNAQLADSYKKYFEMLWNMAKERPRA